MIIVGIDPGVVPTLARLEGQAVEFFEDTAVKVKRGKTVKSEPQPLFIVNCLKRWAPDLVIIENVIIRPGESVAAGGSFMRARGMLEGICAGMGLTYELAHPATWTRQMRVGKGPDAGRQRALTLLPQLSEALGRKKDHNRADAFLMALYGREHVAPKHPLFS